MHFAPSKLKTKGCFTMEVGLSTALNYSHSNANKNGHPVEKNPQKISQRLQQEEQNTKDQNSLAGEKSAVFDEKAEDILETLLADRLENEKYAIKSMLEHKLSPQGEFLPKEQLLQRIDEYIEVKTQTIQEQNSGLVNLATTLKTLYESDFKPLNIAV